MIDTRSTGRSVGGPAVDNTMAGAAVSFGFNLGKIPGQGEDSDPILRDGPDLALLGVFDGMGGAGGTVYETSDGPRSGAYLASRIARDVVEQRMLDLLVPDWNLNGDSAAEDLRRSIKDALQQRLAQLNAPKSGLRSRLLRALPTTMAVLALQRSHRTGRSWLCHVFWAGDSRAYVFGPDGARQLTTDDLRDRGDALTNLHQDSVVSNAASADTEFSVNYRRVELDAPFLLICATDGCFGYLPTPMHFEQLVLKPLLTSSTSDVWSRRIQDQIIPITGDDAAMAVMSVGADLDELKTLYGPRVSDLDAAYLVPIDDQAGTVRDLEQQLADQRRQLRETTQHLWAQYQPVYEELLHAAPLDGESAATDDDALPTVEPGADAAAPSQPVPVPEPSTIEPPVPEPSAIEPLVPEPPATEPSPGSPAESASRPDGGSEDADS